MMINTQENNYSIGGIVINTQHTNYSIGGMVINSVSMMPNLMDIISLNVVN